MYGLTAVPVARRVGVARPPRTRPLLVGGQAWTMELACALASAGLDVLMWAGPDEQREAVRRAGLELAPGELLASATARGAELEGITAVLLLTAEDDFNALAASGLAGAADGPVYRLGARLPSHGGVASYIGGEILFGTSLTRYHVGQRYAAGARIFTCPAGSAIPAGSDLMVLVRANGILAPVPRHPSLPGKGGHHDPPQPRESRLVPHMPRDHNSKEGSGFNRRIVAAPVLDRRDDSTSRTQGYARMSARAKAEMTRRSAFAPA